MLFLGRFNFKYKEITINFLDTEVSYTNGGTQEVKLPFVYNLLSWEHQ